ncbi:DASH family cryptochrome [Pseudohalioglobus lutimaris]|uniref:Cryptochrome DASH n=1 Tax=Pseudohalioglobus lutimaris TaxID=1737061 RepID=A0A2N5X8A5_9GAMM|nr:DASH family cryptochrome [Pseudohalioglobus lutimaris]PLW70710.1 DASH family cryptochrome [Pseudohalioglobus lutimaris]
MRKLYWFQNDLRLQDNPGLHAQMDAGGLLLVYLLPVNRPWCNTTGMGPQRERFLRESLQALQVALAELGQNLLVLEGSPELVIPDLVREYRIDAVATSLTPGYYERKTLNLLRARLEVPLQVHGGNTLFDREDLPFALEDMPRHFTPFKQAVESLESGEPLPVPGSLPRPPAVRFHRVPPAAAQPHTALPVRGGSENARRRLRQFVFEERTVLVYKQTRNCLDGLDGSTTLSPWLANGGISAREVAQAVREFEVTHSANESTYWLLFELLWREFFHWRALRDDVSLFRMRPSGGQKRLHSCTFEPRSFARWCSGSTDYPLVNGLMRQLVATGWMSNRGRQIAASCLINELRLDWRYGAAFFEKHLLDYDVASNYGNWQYIAGVGADPRGGRHFNLDKQAQEYDPRGIFVEKWQGRQPRQPEFVTDAADWPILDE